MTESVPRGVNRVIRVSPECHLIFTMFNSTLHSLSVALGSQYGPACKDSSLIYKVKETKGRTSNSAAKTVKAFPVWPSGGGTLTAR